ncbi:MAG: hypothetical protein H9W81_18450 [Enterococcus sp.]|nr:hypothetical protein [Enterococcus sp.]
MIIRGNRAVFSLDNPILKPHMENGVLSVFLHAGSSKPLIHEERLDLPGMSNTLVEGYVREFTERNGVDYPSNEEFLNEKIALNMAEITEYIRSISKKLMNCEANNFMEELILRLPAGATVGISTRLYSPDPDDIKFDYKIYHRYVAANHLSSVMKKRHVTIYAAYKGKEVELLTHRDND